MKSLQKIFLVLFFSAAMLTSYNGFADTNPPDPPSSHGATGNQPGGGAPIGGGLFILLGLGAAYGGKKWYDHRKMPLDE